MSLLNVLTIFAVALAATALLGGIVTIVAHAARNWLEERRKFKRAGLFELIVQGTERVDWDPDLVAALSRDRSLGADLFSEMSELIRGENLERVRALCRDAGIDLWLLRQLGSFRSDSRRIAAEVLRLFPGEEAVRALTAALDDRASKVRLTAALSLAELDALPPLLVLVAKLVEETRIHSLLLQRLIENVATRCPKEAMELARGRIGKPFLRPIALNALGKAGHLQLGATIADLIEDADPEVRAAALDAVAALGYFDAKGRVRDALSDPVFFVKVRAIEAVRRLELRALVPELVRLLDDPNWWVRFRASETLMIFGHQLSERERKVIEFAPAKRGAA